MGVSPDLNATWAYLRVTSTQLQGRNDEEGMGIGLEPLIFTTRKGGFVCFTGSFSEIDMFVSFDR
jgi:hypothetical protein